MKDFELNHVLRISFLLGPHVLSVLQSIKGKPVTSLQPCKVLLKVCDSNAELPPESCSAEAVIHPGPSVTHLMISSVAA